MNRRHLLRHFSAYLAVTSAACATPHAAFGSMFPGHNDTQSGKGNSMFPDNTPLLQPSRRSEPDDSIQSTKSPDDFRLEGCSLSGDLANQFRFVRSSGIPQIDQATFQEANYLVQVTGMQPSLAFLDDRESRNAFAIKRDIISGRSPHGAVAMGVRLIQKFLQLSTPNPQTNSLCIQAALVHEWAHIAQFYYGVRASRTKYMELMSDFIAGWYLGYKGVFVGARSDPTAPMLCMASSGDTNFNSPGHHGTPQERLEAYHAGFKFVEGGGGGGIRGGFFSGGFGGGYGRAQQPPDFNVAFQHAKQKFIR